VTDIDDVDILDEIVRLTTPPMRQPGDFTTAEYIERWERTNGHSITSGYALGWLAKLVDEGKLEVHKEVYDPQESRYYTIWRPVVQQDN